MSFLDDLVGLAVAEPEDMAKKKVGATEEKAKGRQIIILSYKADELTATAFKNWLQGLADHIHAPVTVTLDQALAELAASRGYKKGMPKRLVR